MSLRACVRVIQILNPATTATVNQDFNFRISGIHTCAVAVEQVTESASGIEVSCRVTSPPPGTTDSQALTSPVQIIAVPAGRARRFRRLPEI